VAAIKKRRLKMSVKQITRGFMVILLVFLFFQSPEYALGSGEPRPEIVTNDDYQLALNEAQFQKLVKLEKQLKSKENKLEKTKNQIAKLKKSR
jgi:hypothetical protein